MTLFDLAKKNIKHNFIHYFLYFASMIFSIMIYYTFVSLSKDPKVVTRIDNDDNLASIFNASSIILIIFVAIFILYSNHFFTRKRKKEIGIYSLLGLRKKEIGRMLFYENFLMGVVALVIGIGLGTLLSKLFVAILIQIMKLDAISNFVFSIDAMVNTVLIFIIITLITSITSYRIIYRTTLLDLFHSESKREKTPKNNPLLAILALILILGGYFIALQPLITADSIWGKIKFEPGMLVILTSVITGTVLLLNNFLPFLLNKIRKNKRIFYNGTNIIGNSQLAFRIASNARTLSTIAVLTGMTLVAIGMVAGIYNNTNKDASLNNPATFEYHIVDEKSNKAALTLAQNNIQSPMAGHQETTISYVKATSDSKMPFAYEPKDGFAVIGLTAYNKLLALEKQNSSELAPLENDEAILISPDSATENDVLNQSFTLKNSTDQKVTITKIITDLPFSTLYQLIIVSDDIAKTLPSKNNIAIQSIMIEQPKDALALSKQMSKVLPENAMFRSYPENYDALMRGNGVLLFIGMFIGMVFLAATGSIIYFKQLTEAYNDVATYDILKKIGLDRKEIRKTIAKQVLATFLIPLILGITHSSIALISLAHLLQMNIAFAAIISTGTFTLMFIAYYFITVNTYTNIVIGKKRNDG
ncbi:FtsX-like permease family protein [Paenilisteria rocourtiae]|uniref:Putative ABC transport system permease protein n=1 Tax=Listeria rocourtiae TaxID=647910 RepID=A0A4R6ZHS0_9LIST|nr:ABC transporter permease [Listeria rocourtiae]EUJ46628.1 ABC transporter permease [Listeria rocourtiae FSL F6-920]MBC1435986.1 ABC transporter permease [Listeria rocourtiae]TDR51768.1 putative ABC transport system permease protein [Listeria rocourtiae]